MATIMTSALETLVWSKRLPATDAQRPTLGNPTGGIRLTQAARTNAKAVDQTSFFRNKMFRESVWFLDMDKQAAHVWFDVIVNGERLGEQLLRITHKESREAGQNNYTTMLHLRGELAKRFREQNYTDAMLTIVKRDGQFSLTLTW